MACHLTAWPLRYAFRVLLGEAQTIGNPYFRGFSVYAEGFMCSPIEHPIGTSLSLGQPCGIFVFSRRVVDGSHQRDSGVWCGGMWASSSPGKPDHHHAVGGAAHYGSG